MSVSGAWWKGNFHNLTTTINRSCTHGRLHAVHLVQPDAPASRSRSTRARCRHRPTRNLDTFDPERKNGYESFNFEGRWRIPGGGQVFGGVAFERERIKNCTSPDDPNYPSTTATAMNGQALCDEFALDIPFRPQLEAVGHQGDRLRHQRQHGVPEQLEPGQLARDDGDARHHALSGQLPGAVPGRPDHHAGRPCSARRR